MNKNLKYGLFLLVLGAIIGTLLVLVNSITAPIIEEQRLEAIKETIKLVAPEVTEITDETKNIDNLPSGIINVYLSKDEKTAIYVARTTGYAGGTVETLIAFDVTSRAIIDAKVTTADKQTAGIGDAILTHDFKLAGKSASVYADLNVGGISSPEYDIITGATISSKAVLNGVKLASANFLEVYGG
ncbi:MAG: FMN-binding protein [Bacilli bacterium]